MAIEYRWAEGRYDRLPALAADLVGHKVDVILANGDAAAAAAKGATLTIPIVFTSGDPVGNGLAASLARPGGNLTGVSLLTVEQMAKRLELLSELVPQAAIALLVNPNTSTTERMIHDEQEAARVKGVQLTILKAATESEIDTAFATLVELHAGALLVSRDPFFNSRREQLVALAARHAVPAIYPWREFTAAGGLISYGPSLTAALRQVGIYTGRILKGEKRSDLPVQQPTRFELVVNLNTAQGARPDDPASHSRAGRRGDRVRARPSVRPMLAPLLALVLTVLSTVLPAGAEQRANIPMVGWLGPNPETGPHRGFRSGLRELGYAEGQNIAIEYRFSEGKVERYAGEIEELGRLNAKVIVTDSFPATNAAKQERLAIPVVFVSADPVGSGFVNSLARPGGNMTGLSLMIEEQFSGKWLELLKEAAPQVSRLAYLWNPANPSNASSLRTMQELAPTLGLTLQSVEIREPKDIDAAFGAIIRDRAGGVIVDSGPVNGASNQTRIVEFAAANHLPAISVFRRFTASGGLISYGPSLYELGRRAAAYVDKILKGAKPADLPVEQPTTFELVINLKTAKSLGLTIPHSLLLRADEVIE